MAKHFTITGTLEEIFLKVEELNKAGKNAVIYFGPFPVGKTAVATADKTSLVNRLTYEALINQLKD